MAGGSTTRNFEHGAFAPNFSSNPDMVGYLHNTPLVSRPRDLTVRVSKSGTAGGTSLPTITGISIDGIAGTIGGGPSSEVTIRLGDSGGPPAFQPGAALPFTINLDPPSGSNIIYPDTYTFTFTFSSSTGVRIGGTGDEHYDISQLISPTTASSKWDSEVVLCGNPGFCIHVTNATSADNPNSTLTAMSGTVTFPSGSGLYVVQAFVTSNSGTSLIANHTPSENGNTFSISGLSITPGSSVDLWIRFSGIPASTTSVVVQTTFGSP